MFITKNVIIISIILSFTSVFGQIKKEIDFSEALSLFGKNGLEKKIKLSNLAKQQVEAEKYSVLANPVFNYLREDLSKDGMRQYEESFSLQQKIDILGQQFMKSSVTESEKYASDCLRAYIEQTLNSELHIQYIEILYQQKYVEIFNSTLNTFQKAFQAAEKRLKEGEISGFELSRFNLEILKYKKELSAATIEERKLKIEFMKNIIPVEGSEQSENESLGEVHFSESILNTDFQVNLKNAEQEALVNRKDLSATKYFAESYEKRLSISKLNRMPSIYLEGGYKRRNDDFKGFVAGVSLEIPIFNSNGIDIQISQAENELTNFYFAQKKRDVVADVRKNYYAFNVLKQQYEYVARKKEEKSILETAVNSYTEGKLSLIELIDAAKAHNELETIKYQAVIELSKAIIKLKTAIGVQSN